MTARLCITGWPMVTSPTPASRPAAAQPVLCWLISSCSACPMLAGPSWSVPPLLACRCGCSPVYHCWPMVTSPTLASWPMVAQPVLHWLAHHTKSLPHRLADRPGYLYFTGQASEGGTWYNAPNGVKIGSTPRNSGVWSYLTEGHWLHRMWCTLVDSLVLNLCSGGAEVVWRMQDLARRLICEWMEDEVIRTFR